MGSPTKLQQEYLKKLKEEEKQLRKHSNLIESFIQLCKKKKLKLTKENFSYIETIGIIVEYPNILNVLNNDIEKDKEDLVKFSLLDRYYKLGANSGYFYSEDYIIMVHPFFRRGFYVGNGFPPYFIDHFLSYENKLAEKFISIDFNVLRINVDNTCIMELDTWYGANFNSEISKINDGIVKLKPPSGIDKISISFFFKNAYSLDIKWDTKDNIKTFQSEEFKTEDVKINYEGKEYYPVRYIHAEFDLDNNYFRHFDGAIHLYTEQEYFKRRDSDFNYNFKNSHHIKTKSLKLFKLNGIIDTEDWVNFSSHFYSGNPLIVEYFEGKYSDKFLELIKSLQRMNSK